MFLDMQICSRFFWKWWIGDRKEVQMEALQSQCDLYLAAGTRCKRVLTKALGFLGQEK